MWADLLPSYPRLKVSGRGSGQWDGLENMRALRHTAVAVGQLVAHTVAAAAADLEIAIGRTNDLVLGLHHKVVVFYCPCLVDGLGTKVGGWWAEKAKALDVVFDERARAEAVAEDGVLELARQQEAAGAVLDGEDDLAPGVVWPPSLLEGPFEAVVYGCLLVLQGAPLSTSGVVAHEFPDSGFTAAPRRK